MPPSTKISIVFGFTHGLAGQRILNPVRQVGSNHLTPAALRLDPDASLCSGVGWSVWFAVPDFIVQNLYLIDDADQLLAILGE